jgi:hypothetical protein
MGMRGCGEVGEEGGVHIFPPEINHISLDILKTFTIHFLYSELKIYMVGTS